MPLPPAAPSDPPPLPPGCAPFPAPPRAAAPGAPVARRRRGGCAALRPAFLAPTAAR